jgi:hypothetical protein
MTKLFQEESGAQMPKDNTTLLVTLVLLAGFAIFIYVLSSESQRRSTIRQSDSFEDCEYRDIAIDKISPTGTRINFISFYDNNELVFSTGHDLIVSGTIRIKECSVPFDAQIVVEISASTENSK